MDQWSHIIPGQHVGIAGMPHLFLKPQFADCRILRWCQAQRVIGHEAQRKET